MRALRGPLPCAHEGYHLWQFTYEAGSTVNAKECEAYKVELRCLRQAKKQSDPLDQPFIPLLRFDARERILAQKEPERLEHWLEKAAVSASVAAVIDEPN